MKLTGRKCINRWSCYCQHHPFFPTPGVQDYTSLYTHPLIRQQNKGLINQCVVTTQCLIPPMATTINIFTHPKWPRSNQRVLSSYPLLGVQMVDRSHLFCPQKTALPSCQKSPLERGGWGESWGIQKMRINRVQSQI